MAITHDPIEKEHNHTVLWVVALVVVMALAYTYNIVTANPESYQMQYNSMVYNDARNPNAQ